MVASTSDTIFNDSKLNKVENIYGFSHLRFPLVQFAVHHATQWKEFRSESITGALEYL